MMQRRIGLAAALAMCVAFLTILAISEKKEGGQPVVFPMQLAEKVSVDELAARAASSGRSLLLPKWMPHNYVLKDVRLFETAILFYSNKDLNISTFEDGYEANVIIQISPSALNPTKEQLTEIIKATPKLELRDVAGRLVILCKDASPDAWMGAHGIQPIMADFHSGEFYYIITARQGEVTPDDMVRIIREMAPVSSDTLR